MQLYSVPSCYRYCNVADFVDSVSVDVMYVGIAEVFTLLSAFIITYVLFRKRFTIFFAAVLEYISADHKINLLKNELYVLNPKIETPLYTTANPLQLYHYVHSLLGYTGYITFSHLVVTYHERRVSNSIE